jgi:hypothetical protein
LWRVRGWDCAPSSAVLPLQTSAFHSTECYNSATYSLKQFRLP